nr:dentin sialophosphoprotein-like isoform X2 [Quercus suber]POE67224.1 dnaj like subfamily c member 7 [Quercus suber]
MPPTAAAAMDVRSPMDSTHSQNPNSDFSFSFGAVPSADFSDNRIPSSNSSSFEAAAAAASSNVARAGSRARPRLVKLRRQQPRSKSVSGSDAGPGFNPFRSDSAANTVSSSGSGSSSSNGFGLLNGDAKCVNFESKGFVFGADGYGNGNLSGLDTNLGLGESVGNVGFVFSAKQSGIESNSSEEMRVNGEKAGKSDVGDAGTVEARSGLEDGKLSDVGFVFQADWSDSGLNLNKEKRENGECGDKLGSEGSGGVKLRTKTECGKHGNVNNVFGDSQSDLPSNLNSEKGECGERREKSDCDGDKGNVEAELVTERCADKSDLGSASISEKREFGMKVSTLDCEINDMLKTGNVVELGKNDDQDFVFDSSWFNSVSMNLPKRESSEDFGNLVSDIEEMMKAVSGTESSSAINFNINGNRSLNDNCDMGAFAFGSDSKKNSSLDECMAGRCPREIKFKSFGNCGSTTTQISDLGSDVEGKGKTAFESSSNVAKASSTSPLFKLPDEMRKMKIDDSENVDGADKTEDADKNSCANPGAAFVFRSSKKASDSLNQSSATCASIGISSCEPFTAQPELGAHENKDGDCSTSNPDGSGVSFTAFSTPEWDPSSFKENLFPEINKNSEFSVKNRSVKDKRSKKKRGKPKPPSLSKQKPGQEQDNVAKESSSQENPGTPGCYSPMDFSPYQETTAANPCSREASVTSQEFSHPDNNFEPSDLHSEVHNDPKDENLANAAGVDINKREQRCRELNEENCCCRNGSCFGSDCSSKGFFSGAETTFSSSKTEQFCSSSSAGVASTDTRTDFNLNMERQEDNCKTPFYFGSSLEDTKERRFTFSASSSAQGSLPATAMKRSYKKKSRAKVGRDSSLDTRSSAAQLSPRTNPSSLFDKEHKSEVHEQVKQGHFSYSAAIQEACEKLRLRGNKAYANGELSKAEDLYTQGIISVPSSERSGCCLKPLLLCYSNRAATRRCLGRIREALGDSMMATALDPNFLKAQMRAANCHLVLGELDDAIQCFNKCLESGGGICLDRKLIIEAAEGLQKAQKVAESTNHSAKLMEQRTSDATLSALEIIDNALSISSYSEKLLEMKSEALLMLRRYDEAIQQCEQSLYFAEKNFASVSTGANMDGSECQSYSSVRLWRWCLISRCYFHLGRLEAALDLLQKLEKVGSIKDKYGFKNLELSISLAVTIRELLRLKNAGNEAFRSGKYTDAIEHYTVALSSNVESRPFAAICLCNRGAAYQALGQIADAIADCSLSIALDRNYAKAVSRRATLHEMIRDYGQAASDLQRLVSILENESGEKVKQSGTPSSVKELRQARRHLPSMEEEAKNGIPLDFYKILGIKPSDTASDIKKAYRKAALRHHPDKAGQFLARSESGDEGRLWKEISQEVHKDADRLFKMIGEAYAVLSDSTKRSQYDLEEEMRKGPKECHVSSSYRRPSDAYSSQFERNSNRRYWRETWKTYGNSNFRW